MGVLAGGAMSTEPRFSKARALRVLDAKASELAAANKFDRSNGTSQLELGDIERAVAYGRMRAFEDFACMIEENFRFDLAGQ